MLCVQKRGAHRKKLSAKITAAKKKNPEEKTSLAASLFSTSSFRAKKSNNINEWFIDSGATSHMTSTKGILLNSKRVNDKHVVVANNEKMPIECAGDVSVVLRSGKKETDAFLRDVEYVPEMSVNLLSVRQMTLKGNKVIFENDKCQIFNKSGELLATAKAFDNLYKLHCDVNVNKSERALTVADDSKLRHRRLAHICDNNLKKVMVATDGMLCKGVNMNVKCVVCIKGKQTRASFNEPGHRANGLLDIVHSDVMGPIRTKSFSGNRFILTFVDDH